MDSIDIVNIDIDNHTQTQTKITNHKPIPIPLIELNDISELLNAQVSEALSNEDVVIDLRSTTEYCRWRFEKNIRLDWETARHGKLYCVLPARGSQLIVAASDSDVLKHCYHTLVESGYKFPYGVWLLPKIDVEVPRYNHIEYNTISEEDATCVNRVLWKPSPVILQSFPLIEKLIASEGDNNKNTDTSESKSISDLRMLDVGAGSGRDAVWPLTHSSPLYPYLSTVVALDSTFAMLQRADALSDMNGVSCAWIPVPKPSDGSGSGIGSDDQTQDHIQSSRKDSDSDSDSDGDGDGDSKKVLLFHADATVAGVFDRALACSLKLHPPKILPTPITPITPITPTAGFHIVHVARYLNRSLFPALRGVTVVGGFLLYHHFLEGSFRPKDKSQHLKRDELKHAFGPDHGFEVVLGKCRCMLCFSLSDLSLYPYLSLYLSLYTLISTYLCIYF